MIIFLGEGGVRLAGEVVVDDAVVLDELEFLGVAGLEHRGRGAAHQDHDVLQVYQPVQVVVVEVGVARAVADEPGQPRLQEVAAFLEVPRDFAGERLDADFAFPLEEALLEVLLHAHFCVLEVARRVQQVVTLRRVVLVQVPRPEPHVLCVSVRVVAVDLRLLGALRYVGDAINLGAQVGQPVKMFEGDQKGRALDQQVQAARVFGGGEVADAFLRLLRGDGLLPQVEQ